ncbi:High cysteine membrane protein [Giardia muris]|uniref:High cysteine membrane protein n=1 Tax=Giardia muris TaxID=5742 RepID=A0A4Z1TDM1_GIAMU|nr:High cysteine membrane protein [Giardia muris]|eukprot:TNJ30651.1 High cysteine membrane protein [Giardia muris]
MRTVIFVFFTCLCLSTNALASYDCDTPQQLSSSADFDLFLRTCPSGSASIQTDLYINISAPYPSFSGSLDSENKSIYVILDSNTTTLSLFETFSGSLKNVTFHVTIPSIGWNHKLVGGLAGVLNTTSFEDVTIYTDISGSTNLNPDQSMKYVGGVAGIAYAMPDSLVVSSNILLTLVTATAGGIVGVYLPDVKTNDNHTNTKFLTKNHAVEANITCLYSECVVGLFIGNTTGGVANSVATGMLYVVGNIDSAIAVGGAVGVLGSSLLNISITLSEFLVRQAHQDGTAAGGLVGLATGTFLGSILIDSCSVIIDTANTDSTIFFMGGAIGLAEGVILTRTSIQITDLTASQTIGGLIGQARSSLIAESHVKLGNVKVIGVKRRQVFNRGYSEQYFLAFEPYDNFGGLLGMAFGSTQLLDSMAYVGTLNYTARRQSVFGGLVGIGYDFDTRRCSCAYEHVIFNRSDNVITGIISQDDQAVLTSGGLLGLVLSDGSNFNGLDGSYGIYRRVEIYDFCAPYAANNSIVLGGLLGSATSLFTTRSTPIVISTSYVLMTVEVTEPSECVNNSRFLFGSLFGYDSTNLSFQNTFSRVNLSTNALSFDSYTSADDLVYGIGILGGLSFDEFIDIENSYVNLTAQYVEGLTVAPLSSLQLMVGAYVDNICYSCNRVYVILPVGDIQTAISISVTNSLLEETYDFSFSTYSHWTFLSGVGPYLQYVPMYTPGPRVSFDSWNGDLQVALNMAVFGWDTTHIYMKNQDSTFPLLDMRFLQSCSIPGCSVCNGSTCMACSEPNYLTDSGCVPCPEECSSCTPSYQIYAPVQETDNKTCTYCILARYAPVTDPTDPNYGHCSLYPTCKLDNCLRCNTTDSSRCALCYPGYVLTLKGLCLPCANDCYLCTSTTDCSLCKNASILPISGLCTYTNTCPGTSCIFCTPDNPNICIYCDDQAVGSGADRLKPNQDGICDWSSDRCTIPHCFSCSQGKELVCEQCESRYHLKSQVGTCETCSPGCLSCHDQNSCSTCLNHDVKPVLGTCEYQVGQCTLRCQSCLGYNEQFCLTCSPGNNLNDVSWTCIPIPPPLIPTYGICLIVISTILVIAAIITIPIIVVRQRRKNKRAMAEASETKTLMTH